jgi:hypothetical protein
VIEPRELFSSQEPTSSSQAGAASARRNGLACPVLPGS